MARCAHCQLPIRPGEETRKRVEFRGGVAYGENMPGGSLEKGAATGLPLEKVLHQKAIPLTERVLTPHGWVQAASLDVGDLVIAGDGSPSRIRVVYNDMTTQYVAAVRLTDGALCRADMGHLWMTDRGVITTQELRPGDRMPLPPAYDGWEQPRGDPYTLGALLGDGFMPGMFVTTADVEIKLLLEARAQGISRSRQTKSGRPIWDVVVRSQEDFILSLGLARAVKREKFLPDSVWAWPAAARLELLRGLMDTDGGVGSRGGQATFTNSSEQLARGVQQLAWSLGGTARVFVPTFTKLKGKTYGPYHTVSIRVPYCPFNLGYKQEAWGRLSRRETMKRQVAEVVPQKYTEKVVCYTIDHSSGLFIVGDFMVTHNCYWIAWKRTNRGGDAVQGTRPGIFDPYEDEDD